MPRRKPESPTDAMPAEGAEQARQVFGLHLAALRRARGLTLDHLARATGLNKGHLSRLERLEKGASIAAVMKIARALEVPVSALFGETVDDASIHIVRAKDEGKPPQGGGDAAFTLLSRASGDPAMEAFLFTPGPEFRPRGHVHHAGTEMIFIIEGRIEIRFNDRTVALEHGDFLQFPGHIPHQLRRIDDPATALIVVSR